MPTFKQSTNMTGPYGSFLAIHFEVGGDEVWNIKDHSGHRPLSLLTLRTNLKQD